MTRRFRAGAAPPRARTLALALVTVGSVVLAALLVLDTRGSTSSARRAHVDPRLLARPNIVLITTDDQRADDMRWMPRTRALLGDAGVSFPRMVSPHPLCCPARAEILTGQYAQNNHVRTNHGRYGGYHRLDPQHTIATWLSDAGYSTAFLGKHLNGYHARFGSDPGWDHFNPVMAGKYSYRRFSAFDDGTMETGTYLTDYLSRKTGSYIRELAAQDRPFFVWTSYVAPHNRLFRCGRPRQCFGPPLPARRHRSLYPGAVPPSFRSPAFNEADVSDKHANVRFHDTVDRAAVRRLHLARIRSLASVDEGVADIVRTLRDTGQLDKTVIAFTSDNGYLMGEHRKVSKNQPYRDALLVPLLVRGPGIPHGAVGSQRVTTVDLAATIADLAGARPDIVVDGQSLVRVLDRPGSARRGGDTQLIQAGPLTHWSHPWFFRGVRTSRYTYVHYGDGFRELYDHRRDPAELRNVARLPAYRAVVAELERRTDRLKACRGRACNARFGPAPRPR